MTVQQHIIVLIFNEDNIYIKCITLLHIIILQQQSMKLWVREAILSWTC